MAPAARLRIYRHHYKSSLVEALMAIYPVVCRLVDERFFAFAAHEYIRSLPQRLVCLHEYGADFAEFLAGFPPCRELVYLPDVARLEQQINASLHSPAEKALGTEAFLDATVRDYPRLVFRLPPRCVISTPPGPSTVSGSASRRGGRPPSISAKAATSWKSASAARRSSSAAQYAAIGSPPRASGRRDAGKRSRRRAVCRSHARSGDGAAPAPGRRACRRFSPRRPIPEPQSGDTFHDDDPSISPTPGLDPCGDWSKA